MKYIIVVLFLSVLILSVSCGDEDMSSEDTPVRVSKGCTEFGIDVYVNDEASKINKGCFFYTDSISDSIFLGCFTEFEQERYIDSLDCEEIEFSTLWQQGCLDCQD